MALTFDNPALRYYGVAVVALAFKQLVTNMNVGLIKGRVKVVGSPEDAMFVRNAVNKKSSFGTDHPDVLRAYRLIQNDHENIYIFYTLGLLYVLAGASSRGAAIHFGIYVLSRYAHSLAYHFALQPHRAITFFGSIGVKLSLMYRIFQAAYLSSDYF